MSRETCPHIDCVIANVRSGPQCVELQEKKRRQAYRWKNQGVVDVRTVLADDIFYGDFCSFHKKQQQKCNDVRE
jgi:uncharacterized protein YbaA (DUF1428 family)